eukprot:GCRY01006794.1.p3 GENE.GCRY01006794.1~~GCRY01006794.1.p3  ORF type:complete len:102 (+),score=15.49 GCRY01006794.1:188-493(+)
MTGAFGVGAAAVSGEGQGPCFVFYVLWLRLCCGAPSLPPAATPQGLGGWLCFRRNSDEEGVTGLQCSVVSEMCLQLGLRTIKEEDSLSPTGNWTHPFEECR